MQRRKIPSLITTRCAGWHRAGGIHPRRRANRRPDNRDLDHPCRPRRDQDPIAHVLGDKAVEPATVSATAGSSGRLRSGSTAPASRFHGAVLDSMELTTARSPWTPHTVRCGVKATVACSSASRLISFWQSAQRFRGTRFGSHLLNSAWRVSVRTSLWSHRRHLTEGSPRPGTMQSNM